MREAHAVADLIDRFVSVLVAPALDAVANSPKVSNTVLQQRRHHLDRVRAGHDRLHRIDRLMHPSGYRERAAIDADRIASQRRRSSSSSESIVAATARCRDVGIDVSLVETIEEHETLRTD